MIRVQRIIFLILFFKFLIPDCLFSKQTTDNYPKNRFGITPFFIMNFSSSQKDNSYFVADTIQRPRLFSDSLFSVNYRKVSDIARYGTRYKIINSVNTEYGHIEVNYTLQNFLKNANYSDSSLLTGFNLVNENLMQGRTLYSDLEYYIPIAEKDLFYGVWRSQLTKSSSDEEIQQSIIKGTNTLIGLGYSDIGSDFLPFITHLMEEQHIFNYDITRTYGFGKGSRGIVASVDILNALGSQNSKNKFGVCRDIHETGRQLLKPMLETFFNHFYPDMKIDFDEYLFLQSWTTDASHHVTLSLINPLDTKVVYELDWGRVLEKTNNYGYNNGRMYGNNLRIWQFDKEKQMSIPIDFKRTQFGKILDEDILTRKEYQQFNGIYDEESYSNIRYIKGMGKYGNLNFSIGSYYPDQRYFLTSYYLHTKKKQINKFLNHSTKVALQAVVHEDTRRKIMLYPQTDWQFTTSLMGIPRVISKFETPKFEIAGNFTFDAYLNQQFDIFLITNSFHTNEGSKDVKVTSHSGDGNLSFSNGISINYLSDDKSFYSSLTLQSRSCLLPKDIRLFSPNPVVLLQNIRFITPALDLISNTILKLNEKNSLSVNSMAEFTNKDAILFSGSLSAKFAISKNSYLVTSVGKNAQIKGMSYFWYPISRSQVDLQFIFFDNALSLSLLGNYASELSVNISLRKYF